MFTVVLVFMCLRFGATFLTHRHALKCTGTKTRDRTSSRKCIHQHTKILIHSNIPCTYLHAHIYTHIYAHTHTHTHTHTHLHTFTHTYTYTRAHPHTHTHTYTHTHSQGPSAQSAVYYAYTSCSCACYISDLAFYCQ